MSPRAPTSIRHTLAQPAFMSTRVLLGFLCLPLVFLTYTLLSCLVPWRSMQALGLPLLGLIAVAGLHGVDLLCGGRRLKPHRIAYVFLLGMIAAISLEIGALLSIAGAPSEGRLARHDEHQRHEVRRMIRGGNWRGAILAGGDIASVLDAHILLDIGYAHGRLGDHMKAQAAYGRAIALNPGNLAARYEMARSYQKAGDLAEAAAEFRSILMMNEMLPDVHFAYSSVLAQLGQNEASLYHVDRAIALYPERNPSRESASQLRAVLLSDTRR